MSSSSPELPPVTPPPRFMTRRGDTGPGLCVVCHAAPHDATCPVTHLAELVRELAAHMGTFVADARDTLQAIEKLLRDENSR